MNLSGRLKPRNEKKNPVSVMAAALVVMYLVSGLLLLLLALLLYKMELSAAVVKIGTIAIYVISCFVGGFFVGKQIQDKRYLWGLAAGGIYFVLLFVVSLLIKQGMGTEVLFEPMKIFTTAVLCVVSGMAGGMVS